MEYLFIYFYIPNTSYSISHYIIKIFVIIFLGSQESLFVTLTFFQSQLCLLNFCFYFLTQTKRISHYALVVREKKRSVDIKKEGEKCCVKLVKICITSHGLHQNICIGMNCYSFGIRDDLLYWAALVSRYFNSGETYVDIPGKEEKCFTVKKSIADSLKNSMDLQVGQRSPYHVTNIGTWGNNCRAYSQVLYNEFSSNEYSGNLPECSNNDSNTRNTSPRK